MKIEKLRPCIARKPNVHIQNFVFTLDKVDTDRLLGFGQKKIGYFLAVCKKIKNKLIVIKCLPNMFKFNRFYFWFS